METYEQELVRARVRFDVLPDGTIEGDDGAGGMLAATLRYVCRMGSQAGVLLGLGDLERVSTLSSIAVMARVAGDSPHLSIKAEVGGETLRRPQPVFESGVGVQDAIDRALRRVTFELASSWVAIISDDGRLVGAMHDESLGHGAPEAVAEVGVRALAVLGALDESMRETAVWLDFVRGSVLVGAIGEHAVFAHADKVEASEVVRTITAVQGLFARVDLAHARQVTESQRA